MFFALNDFEVRLGYLGQHADKMPERVKNAVHTIRLYGFAIAWSRRVLCISASLTIWGWLCWCMGFIRGVGART